MGCTGIDLLQKLARCGQRQRPTSQLEQRATQAQIEVVQSGRVLVALAWYHGKLSQLLCKGGLSQDGVDPRRIVEKSEYRVGHSRFAYRGIEICAPVAAEPDNEADGRPVCEGQ